MVSKRAVRFCLLTQYFWPEGGAPPGRLYELCLRLRKHGFLVTVVTCLPNYPQGRIYEGYRGKLRMTEYSEGIRIIRTACYPTQSPRFVKRMTSYLSFALSAAVLGIRGLGKQDVLMVESPPLFLGPTALWLGWLSGAKVVFNVSDVWPLSVIRAGYVAGDSLAAGMSFRLERYLYEHVAMVTGTSPGLIGEIRSRFPHVRSEVITNGVDTRRFGPSRADPAVRREMSIPDGAFTVGYCGLHGLLQGLDVVIEAAGHLRDEPNVRFVLVGDGPMKADLVAAAEREGLENVIFVPIQPRSRMPTIVASMDAALVCLGKDLPTVPVKIYEAMASGVPTVAVTGGELQEFVEREGIALRVPVGDGKALAEAVRQLYRKPSLRRQLRDRAMDVVQRFDRDRIAAQAAGLLRSLVGSQQNMEAIAWDGS
jgi:glycosyltransferase involved in cell wall biosynthesis